MKDQPLLKEAIVTGAYGAIGTAIAAGIVAAGGWHVTLVGRDPVKLEETRQQLQRVHPSVNIGTETVDLGLHSDIRSFSQRWNKPLHLLVNNAATAPRKRTETAEGIEIQWATNVLGYFWMIRYFAPFMKEAGHARIINVASYWAGGLDLADPEYRSRQYDNDAAYRQAKQADRMLSVAFAGRLRNTGITVNACHPGDVNSKLSNFFGCGGSETPEEGASTPLYLALSKEAEGITGKYFEHRALANCRFSSDAEAVNRLFRLCDSRFPE